MSHLDEVSFLHRDSALHFELPKPGYEVLSRFIFTLFDGSKVTDGDFWLNPVIIVVENTFHLLPGLNRISWQAGVPSKGLNFKRGLFSMTMHWTENLPMCSTDEAWGSSPLNKVKFGTLKPGDKGGDLKH